MSLYRRHITAVTVSVTILALIEIILMAISGDEQTTRREKLNLQLIGFGIFPPVILLLSIVLITNKTVPHLIIGLIGFILSISILLMYVVLG